MELLRLAPGRGNPSGFRVGAGSGRVETLGSNPPQVATGRVGAGRNSVTRQAITFG